MGYIFKHTQTLEGNNIETTTNIFTSPIYPTKEQARTEGFLYWNNAKGIDWNVYSKEIAELTLFAKDNNSEFREWGGIKGTAGVTRPVVND